MTDKKELHDEAKALLANKAFTESILKLRKQWFQEMLAVVPDGSGYPLTMALACARIRALESIPTELGVMINDHILDKNKNG